LSIARVSDVCGVAFAVSWYRLFKSLAQLQAAPNCDEFAIVVIEVQQFGIRLRLDCVVVLAARDRHKAGRPRGANQGADAEGWQRW